MDGIGEGSFKPVKFSAAMSKTEIPLIKYPLQIGAEEAEDQP
jgi:hypothetical protein